jgi:citrate lyase gamma subunit
MRGAAKPMHVMGHCRLLLPPLAFPVGLPSLACNCVPEAGSDKSKHEPIRNNPSKTYRVAHLSHSVQQHQQGAVLSQQLAQVLQGALQLLRSQTKHAQTRALQCTFAARAHQAVVTYDNRYNNFVI